MTAHRSFPIEDLEGVADALLNDPDPVFPVVETTTEAKRPAPASAQTTWVDFAHRFMGALHRPSTKQPKGEK